MNAQSSFVGTVRGRVFNPVSGSYVRDAQIGVKNSNRSAVTEANGGYELLNSPAGPVTVTVEYNGYETAPAIVMVVAGQITVQDFELRIAAAAAGKPRDGDVVRHSAFTVSSEREGNSKVIMAQRRNMNISTSVSSDIFGDVTDGNVGEFLK